MSEETLLAHTISHIRRVVLLIIGAFVVYHSVLHLESKSDSCQWLLQYGKFVANYKWQPYGCLFYNYNITDSKLCLRRVVAATAGSSSQHSSSSYLPTNKTPNHLVFLGDSRMLQLYHYLIEHIFARTSYIPIERNYSQLDGTIKQDTRYDDSELGLTIEFKWRPNPTLEMFEDFEQLIHPHSMYKKMLSDPGEEQKSTPTLRNTRLVRPCNRIVIVGHSFYPSGNKLRDQSNSLDTEAYKTNMTRLLTHLKQLKMQDNSVRILWSLQDPIIEKGLYSQFNASNTQIDELNLITESLIETMSIRNLSLWASHRTITKSLADFMDNDGIHASKFILDFKAQIILNYMCNQIFGYDGTCCSCIRGVDFTQMFFISISFLVISAYLIQTVGAYVCWHNSKDRNSLVKWQKVPDYDNTTSSSEVQEDNEDNQCNNSVDIDHIVLTDVKSTRSSRGVLALIDEELLINLAKLFIAILFMFVCDRTNFFMKENKFFTLANFILPIIYMFALGIFFTDTQPVGSNLPSTAFILSRIQTDEWKGWMQLVVLIYNLSNAQDNLRLYMLIRALLSSYLFLTGFGHFTYFYNTGNLSYRRLLQVILRLNLLVLFLCLCMSRPYQYYYFVPLVTFWYIIIFVVMKIKPIKNIDRPSANDHFWLLFKISLLTGLITLLYLSEVFFEKIFLLAPWRFLFASNGEDTAIKGWWKHWSVDRYSVLFGMIYGLIHWTVVAPYFGIYSTYVPTTTRDIACHSRESSQGSQDGLVISNPLIMFQENIRSRGSLFKTMALVGISSYALFAATCSDKASCDEIHAYVSVIPIISYLILRNSNELVRSRHSALFAFIGRISLELSLCQYHIWLAADQRGLLVLVPSNPTLNLVTTSIIFVTIAHKLNFINKQLVQYIYSYL